MDRNQLASFFNNYEDFVQTFNFYMPHKTFKKGRDSDFEFHPEEAFNAINEMPINEETEFFTNICNAFKTEATNRYNALNNAFTPQKNILTEQFLNNLLEDARKKLIVEKPPFYKIPTIPQEEKELRQRAQSRAFEILMKKEAEDSVCCHMPDLFTDKVPARNVQQVLRPDKISEAEMKQYISNLEVWSRVEKISALKRQNAQIPEELKVNYINSGKYDEDRKKIAEIFENRMKTAFKAMDEIANAKTDEEYLDVIEKNYSYVKLLVETGLSQFNNLYNALGITEGDLSPEFVSLWKANAELGVVIAGSQRLNIMANPLYPIIKSEDFVKYNDYLEKLLPIDAAVLREKYSVPGMTVLGPAVGQLNAFQGYTVSHSRETEDAYMLNVSSMLSYYAKKYFDEDNYKNLIFIDKNGSAITNVDDISRMVVHGEEVNVLTPNAMMMVPIKISPTGMPMDQAPVTSPFYKEISQTFTEINKLNDKLVPRLKMSFRNNEGKTVEQVNKEFREDLATNLQRNYGDHRRLEAHLRAKAITAKVGNGLTLQVDSKALTEFDRLTEKFGEMPQRDCYMGRAFLQLLHTEGDEQARKFNERLYLSYKLGTDEAKQIYGNYINRMFNIDLREVANAFKSPLAAVEYCEKNRDILELAYTINANDGSNMLLTDGVRQLASNNAFVLQTVQELKEYVDAISNGWFMAGIYNQHAIQNPNVSMYLQARPDRNSKEIQLLDGFERIRKAAEGIERVANEAQEKVGSTIVKDITELNGNNEEVRRATYLSEEDKDHLNNTHLRLRTQQEMQALNTPIALSGTKETRTDFYKALFNKEIVHGRINGRGYNNFAEFIDANDTLFHKYIVRNSGYYDTLVNNMELFERKLNGDATAFPEDRRDNPVVNLEDFTKLKEEFSSYIMHKDLDRMAKGKTVGSYTTNSRDDNRYKFAQKMLKILEETVNFEPMRNSEIQKTRGVAQQRAQVAPNINNINNINNVNNGINVDNNEIDKDDGSILYNKNVILDLNIIENENNGNKQEYVAGELNNEKQEELQNNIIENIGDNYVYDPKKEEKEEDDIVEKIIKEETKEKE